MKIGRSCEAGLGDDSCIGSVVVVVVKEVLVVCVRDEIGGEMSSDGLQ